MKFPSLELSRNQALVLGIGSVVAVVGLTWLVLSNGGTGTPTTSTTAATVPPSTEISTTSSTLPEPTTTSASVTTTTAGAEPTTTTAGAEPTTTTGVFDEVAAVEVFVGDFADAIDKGDSGFLYDRLHPAVKATYDEAECRAYIEDRIIVLENYRPVGPVTGPFDSQFGEFPITSYEVPVAFEFNGEQFESTEEFSLTEGTVRWFAECN